MAAHACLKNEFMEDEKYHNLMSWLILSQIISSCLFLLLNRAHSAEASSSPERSASAEMASTSKTQTDVDTSNVDFTTVGRRRRGRARRYGMFMLFAFVYEATLKTFVGLLFVMFEKQYAHIYPD